MNSWPLLLAPGRRKHFATVVACGLGQALAAGSIALLIRHTFDTLLRANAAPMLEDAVLAAAGFLIAGIAIYLFRIVERGAAEALAQQYIAQLRQRIFDRIVNADRAAFRQKRRGHLMVRFVGDLGAVRNWIADGFSQITVAAIVLPAVSIVLLTIHAKIVLAVLALFSISFLSIFLLRRSLRHRHAVARLNRGKMAGELGEKLTNAPVINAFGQIQREKRRLRKRSEDVIDASIARRRHSATATGIPDAAAYAAMGIIIVLGAVEIRSATATPGDIIAILTTLGLIAAPLKELAGVFDRWRNFSVAKEKIGNVLSLPQLKTAPRQGIGLKDGAGELTFQNVLLPGKNRAFSATVPAGCFIIVDGPNASGKSTLLNASAALTDLVSGTIYLDGCDYTKTKRLHLRKAIGVFSDDLPLLKGSIRRNIKYRAPKIDDAELNQIISACGLENFLNAMPHGIETRIAEGGNDLSPGLRARLQLARAIAGNPRLLILDTPDLTLDDEGNGALFEFLSRREQTVLIASKSDRIRRLADQIWRLKDHSVEIIRHPRPSSNQSNILRLPAARHE